MSSIPKDSIQLSDHFTAGRILRFCTPTMFMMLFTSLYGVVDGLFVSNFVGENAFASVNLVMPAIMILCGFGTIFGSGGTALISMTRGQGKEEKANQYFSMMIEVAAIIGVIVTILGVIFMKQIVLLLGASPAMLEDAVLYGRISVSFVVATQFQYMFQSFMNLAERPKMGLIITISAGVTNMVLDAVFIAGFGWGVGGAALATGISELVGGFLPLLYFLRPNKTFLRFRWTKLEWIPIRKAAYNGMSELMTNVSGSIVAMAYNMQLMRYAGANGVAAYGTIMYVQYIFLAMMFGYAMGSSPVIGYHYGARNNRELNNLLRISFCVEYIGGLLMFVAAQILVPTIARIFVGYNPELLELTVHAFRIFLFAFLLSGGNMFTSAFFTSLNNGTISAIVSFVRTLVFELLSVLILPRIFGLNGIWWSVFVAEIASAIMSWAFLVGKNKQYHYFQGKSPLNP